MLPEQCTCKNEDKVLAELERVLQDLVGSSAMMAIQHYFARNFSLRNMADMHRKPKSFLEGLISLFGEGGRVIARTLAANLESQIPGGNCQFLVALRTAAHVRD